MCGIIGVYWKASQVSGEYSDRMHKACEEMLETLHFRGPDERGLVDLGPAILGHTRLSIIDLTTGSQPIFNEDKTVAVVLNGEIYNFLELRRDLESRGHVFTTRSDTEVIVHLYEEIGQNVFSRLNGMFAVLIYDKKNNTILGARDRTGEKPFIYCENPNAFIFASEVKSILKAPDVSREIDKEGLALYLNSLAVPAPHTIFKQIRKLPPAHFLKIKGKKLEIRKYWDPQIEIDWNLDEKTIVDTFDDLFSDAVKIRLIADVPLGVFLSGGIDSSAVVAFMSKHCPGQVKTYSVGFGDEIDERPYARKVAERYHTHHTELFIDEEIDDVVLEVLEYYDEPFGDSSAVPTYMISREARKHVKVILTGDGGDELFAGYPSYLDQKYQLLGRISSRLFKEINQCIIKSLGREYLDRWYPRRSWPWAMKHWLWVRTYYTDKELSNFLTIPEDFIYQFFKNNHWLEVKDNNALSISYEYDLNYYLPDDLLKKVDMASMLTSLECRAPFLDHRMIEFSLKIPPHMKVKNDVLKYALKESLKEHLPYEILHRPKTGFGAPVESWIRNQLKSLVQDLLAAGCRIESMIPRRVIERAKEEVYSLSQSIEYRNPQKLWLLFVLEVWMRRYC